jgi:hypothetical protein
VGPAVGAYVGLNVGANEGIAVGAVVAKQLVLLDCFSAKPARHAQNSCGFTLIVVTVAFVLVLELRRRDFGITSKELRIGPDTRSASFIVGSDSHADKQSFIPAAGSPNSLHDAEIGQFSHVPMLS